MHPKSNRLKQKLAAGQPIIGTWLMLLRHPSVVAQVSGLGYDFLRLDMEHTQISLEDVALFAAVARVHDIELQVRVPSRERRWITAVLDAGVWNILVPQIDTPEQAAELVQCARHSPLGSRGTFEPGPHNDYVPEDQMADELGHANENVYITVMIESKRGFDNLAEIVATQGIDSFTTGRADLAQDLGTYRSPDRAQTTSPYEDELLHVATAAGKVPSSSAWGVAELNEKIRRGFREIYINTDTAFIRGEFAAFSRSVADMGRGHGR